MRDVIQFYSERPEEDRLARGLGLIEFERTREILLARLPPAPSDILDVGGATGVYSEWLNALGHRPRLFDLTLGHIAEARARRPGIPSAVADARALPCPGGAFDVVLLLGPLYHLAARDDRVRALVEARRVCKPGGLVVAAAIGRLASLCASLVDGWFDDPASVAMIDRDIADGQHRNDAGLPDRFTTAFFHRPEELAGEVRSAGLRLEELLPVEAASWLATGSQSGFERCWSDPARRERLMQLARAVERDPLALAITPHLLAVARR